MYFKFTNSLTKTTLRVYFEDDPNFQELKSGEMVFVPINDKRIFILAPEGTGLILSSGDYFYFEFDQLQASKEVDGQVWDILSVYPRLDLKNIKALEATSVVIASGGGDGTVGDPQEPIPKNN